jgi:hypothetical protein
MNDQVSALRTALEPLGLEASNIVQSRSDLRFDVVLTGRPVAGVDETVAIPTAVGAAGFDFLDATIEGSVARYAAAVIPALSGATLTSVLRTAEIAVEESDWLPSEDLLREIALLRESMKLPAGADDRFQSARRHAMRISRLARKAVETSMLVVEPGEANPLLDPVSWDDAHWAEGHWFAAEAA